MEGYPGTNPGTTPGTNLGTNLGNNPGTNLGTNPGSNQGTNLGRVFIRVQIQVLIWVLLRVLIRVLNLVLIRVLVRVLIRVLVRVLVRVLIRVLIRLLLRAWGFSVRHTKQQHVTEASPSRSLRDLEKAGVHSNMCACGGAKAMCAIHQLRPVVSRVCWARMVMLTELTKDTIREEPPPTIFPTLISTDPPSTIQHHPGGP